MSRSDNSYRLKSALPELEAIDMELSRQISYIFGRDPGCQIQLNDARVSRRHAELAWADGAFQLTDLSSKNGTLVNGRPIKRLILEPGDRLEVGDSQFILIGPSQAGRQPRADRIECSHCGRWNDAWRDQCPGCGSPVNLGD